MSEQQLIDLGLKISALRKYKGMTAKELALRAGISEPTLRNAEHGRSVGTDVIAKISDALGVNLI